MVLSWVDPGHNIVVLSWVNCGPPGGEILGKVWYLNFRKIAFPQTWLSGASLGRPRSAAIVRSWVKCGAFFLKKNQNGIILFMTKCLKYIAL